MFKKQGRVKTTKFPITTPESGSLKLILSACSQSGKFESPLQKTLNKCWMKVKDDYRGWFVNRQNFKIGTLNTTFVSPEIWVAQAVVYNEKDELDGKALSDVVKKLVDLAKYESANVHLSYLLIEELPGIREQLETALIPEGINLYVYEAPNS